MMAEIEDLTELAKTHGFKAPLFQLPQQNELEGMLPLIPLLSLTEKQMTIIDAALKMAGDHNLKICMLSDIAHLLGNSLANIRKHFKVLIEVGILREEKCTTDPTNRRQGSIFILQIPPHIIGTTSKPLSEPAEVIPLEKVDVVELTSLADAANSDLITSVLFGAFNYNRKSRESRLDSNVIWRGERIPVVSVSNVGERIAYIGDIRYYIAIQNVLEQIIKQNPGYRETFNIPVNSVLAAMNKVKSSGERKNLLAAIRRLSSTTFQINKLPRWFLEQSNMSANSKLNIAILHLKLEAVSSGLEGKVVLQIQFPRELIKALFSKINKSKAGTGLQSIAEINPIVMSIKDRMVLAFGLWSQFYFKQNTIESCSWLQLKDRIAPQMTLKDFKLAFTKTLRLHMCKAFRLVEENALMVKVEDTSYKPEFQGDIATKITSKILGVNVVLEDDEFFLTADYGDKFVGLEALGYLSQQIGYKGL